MTDDNPLLMNGFVVSEENLQSYSNLPFDQFQYPSVVDSLMFTSTAEPLSSLFSSAPSTSLSIGGDSVIQQLSIPTLIDLPYDDCHSLSIEEEVTINENDDHVNHAHNQVRIDAEVHVSALRRAYFEM